MNHLSGILYELKILIWILLCCNLIIYSLLKLNLNLVDVVNQAMFKHPKWNMEVAYFVSINIL